jgi:hypothetical protein
VRITRQVSNFSLLSVTLHSTRVALKVKFGVKFLVKKGKEERASGEIGAPGTRSDSV